MQTWPTVTAAQEYWLDAWQRSILFLDVLRERGNRAEKQKRGKEKKAAPDKRVHNDCLPRVPVLIELTSDAILDSAGPQLQYSQWLARQVHFGECKKCKKYNGLLGGRRPPSASVRDRTVITLCHVRRQPNGSIDRYGEYYTKI